MASGDHASLPIGEQTARWNLQQLSPDQLFLAFDTSGLPAGCSLQAVMDNGRGGSSQPFTLAQILPMPQIDSFTASPDDPPNGTRQFQLTGTNLEMIEKLGWDESNPVDLSGLPAPLPGPGLKQSIGSKSSRPAHIPTPISTFGCAGTSKRVRRRSRLQHYRLRRPLLRRLLLSRPPPPRPLRLPTQRHRRVRRTMQLRRSKLAAIKRPI